VGDALLAHRNAENGDLMLQIIAYSPVQFYKATAAMPNSVPIVSTASPVPSMNIEIRDLSTVHPYEKNPRLNDKEVNVDGVIIVSYTKPQSSDCGVIPSCVEFVQGPAVEIRLVPEHRNA